MSKLHSRHYLQIAAKYYSFQTVDKTKCR